MANPTNNFRQSEPPVRITTPITSAAPNAEKKPTTASPDATFSTTAAPIKITIDPNTFVRALTPRTNTTFAEREQLKGQGRCFHLQTTGPHSKRLSATKPIHGCRRARAWAIGKLKNTTAAAVAVVNAETSPNDGTHNK
jgi:hypothetical protein